MIRIFKLFIWVVAFALIIGFSVYVSVVLLIESEETVVVPDLVGKDVVYCLELLTDLGLDIKVKNSQYNDTVPKHHVIDQYPAPGAEIKKGRDVHLFLSKGEKYLQLPDLAGDSIEQAHLVLEANGLLAGVTTRIHHDGSLPFHVVAQEPGAGQMVARGSAVNLLSSLGSRPVAYVMPDLTGMPFSSAILFLEEAGLSPGEITSAADDKYPENTVVSQQPEFGARIVQGNRVNLVINRSSGYNRLSLRAGSGGVNLFRYRLEKGFLNRHIRLVLNCYGLSVDMINDYKKPDEEVWVLVPTRRNAAIFLYEDNELVRTEVFSGS